MTKNAPPGLTTPRLPQLLLLQLSSSSVLFCLLSGCSQWPSATAIEAPRRGWVASGDTNADARHDTLTGHWAAQDASSSSSSSGSSSSSSSDDGGGGGGGGGDSGDSGGSGGGGSSLGRHRPHTTTSSSSCGDLTAALRFGELLRQPPQLQPLLSEATLAAYPAAGRWLADLQLHADRGGL